MNTPNRRLLLIFLQVGTLCISAIYAAYGFSEDNSQTTQKKNQKASWVAHLLRQDFNARLPELTFKKIKLPVILVARKNELRPMVEIEGQFEKPDWQMFVQNDSPVNKNPHGNGFLVHAFLNSQVNEIYFTAKGPNREVLTETVYIFAPEAQEFEIVSPWNAVTASAGYASFFYQQTAFGVLSSRSALIGIGYTSPEAGSRFGLTGQADMTVLNFSSEPIKANPQLIDARFGLSYRLSVAEQSRWRYRLLAGVSYLTLMSNGSPFGFADLWGPNFGLRAMYYNNIRSSFVLEMHMVPYQSVQLDRQRGLQLSATWSKALKSLRRQDISIKYSTSAFESSGQSIDVGFLSISLGYSI